MPAVTVKEVTDETIKIAWLLGEGPNSTSLKDAIILSEKNTLIVGTENTAYLPPGANVVFKNNFFLLQPYSEGVEPDVLKKALQDRTEDHTKKEEAFKEAQTALGEIYEIYKTYNIPQGS